MANYTTLREGSSNKEEIARLQQALKDAGYGNYLGNAGVDGIYGSGTKAAVEAYQRDKKLAVDGIAGDQTLGSLYENSQQVQQTTQPAAPAVPTAPVAAPQQPEYRYDAEADPVYQAAQQKVADVEGQKPVIRGTYDQQVEQLYQDLMGRKDFSYDLNGDALWQQYKDQYTTQGKLAMMDTMGQAAALTGGYGSSYAQGAGQQAYQGYLQQLNDRIPELHQLALQRYQMEQDVLQGKLDTARGMQAEEYARDRDAQSDWLAQLGLAREDAQKAYDRGQSAWYTEEQLRREDEETAYGREQDAYSRQQDNYNKLMTLIAGTGYTPSDAELAEAGMTRSQATALAAAYDREGAASSGGGGYPETKEISIPSEIKSQIGKYDTDAEKQSYIDRLEVTGVISGAQAEYLRSVYLAPSGSLTGTETENTKRFDSVVMTKDAWKRRTGSEQGYESYIEIMLNGWLEEDKLTDAEAAWIITKYAI